MKISEVIRREKPEVQEELKSIFKGFPPEAEVYVKEVPKGTCLVSAGEPCKYVYYILSGELNPYYIYGNNAFLARKLIQNTVIGDIAALGNKETYSTTVMTLTKCRVMEIRVSDYWTWALSNTEFLRRQMQNVIDILLGELLDKRYIEGESLEIRMLSYFIWYCQKEGLKNFKAISVEKTRDEIADEIGGISVRTINRKLVKFAEMGLVSVVRGKIRITSEQLKAIEAYVLEEEHLR